MTSSMPDYSGDLDDTQNTELIRWSGESVDEQFSLRAHVSIDLHTCADGHMHYVLYSQTELMLDTLEEALSVASGMNERYVQEGFQMQKVEL